MFSIRRITDEQFSDGTTIDGSRLESALLALEKWGDSIPDGDFANRWMQSQLIMKYLPMTEGADSTLAASTFVGNVRHAPFLPIYNDRDSENPMRLKGTRLPWNLPYREYTAAFDNDYNDQCAWTTSLHTGSKPVIIDAFGAFLQTDTTEYVNNFRYPVSGFIPGNEIPGGPVRDIQLIIGADNPFVSERQGLNSVLFHRSLFKSDAVRQSRANPAAFTDMNPSLSSVAGMSILPADCLSIESKGLAIPVPPFTRLRFSIVLPIGYEPWNDTPWRSSIPTVTITILEGLSNG